MAKECLAGEREKKVRMMFKHIRFMDEARPTRSISPVKMFKIFIFGIWPAMQRSGVGDFSAGELAELVAAVEPSPGAFIGSSSGGSRFVQVTLLKTQPFCFQCEG